MGWDHLAMVRVEEIADGLRRLGLGGRRVSGDSHKFDAIEPALLCDTPTCRCHAAHHQRLAVL